MRRGRDAEAEAVGYAVAQMFAEDPSMLGLDVRYDDCGRHVTITGDFNLVLSVDELNHLTARAAAAARGAEEGAEA